MEDGSCNASRYIRNAVTLGSIINSNEQRMATKFPLLDSLNLTEVFGFFPLLRALAPHSLRIKLSNRNINIALTVTTK
jgi:hypothetical protein